MPKKPNKRDTIRRIRQNLNDASGALNRAHQDLRERSCLSNSFHSRLIDAIDMLDCALETGRKEWKDV